MASSHEFLDRTGHKTWRLSIRINSGPQDEHGWLNVTVRCEGNYGQAWIHGNIMTLGNFARWLEELVEMNSTLSENAELSSTESAVHFLMSINKMGQIAAEVEIGCFDGMHEEKHFFQFQSDQSYLPSLILQLRKKLPLLK
jgi:hypothetical protein